MLAPSQMITLASQMLAVRARRSDVLDGLRQPREGTRRVQDVNGRPLDTSPEAYEVQTRVYRTFTAEEKGEMAARMSDEIREISKAGIRLRHPTYSDREVTRSLVGLLYGEELARKVWQHPVHEPE